MHYKYHDQERGKLLEPHEVIAHGVGDPRLLTSSPSARAASTADLADPPLRPGCEAFLSCPSRIGNELHYRKDSVRQA